ncbi:MAG: TIM-barrel domain-containing protein [Anaerolineaceae bacterium]
MKDNFKLDFQPQARKEAIVQKDTVRFSVLTDQLIRMEFDLTQKFEDRPTQVFWYRDLPVPEFQVSIDQKLLTIETEKLILTYKTSEWGFHHDFLSITLKYNGNTWRYGQEDNFNLKGTLRTLDRLDGGLLTEPGLVSPTGWSVYDDSQSLVFNDDGWLVNRNSPPGAVDLYFFGYGKNYTQCIIDFQKISGRPPLLPRFALGNWWSKYWPYHQDELVTLMNDFQAKGIPLSVCIVDMDWHIVDTGNESSGWTGYTWNPELFPDPPIFFEQIHKMGLKTALNLHPASGVYPHEAQYEQMANRMDIDPESKQPIPFNIADADFASAYFEILHHPLEDMGVDFWWIDWQQGRKSSLAGLDPLFWLNHLHFHDLTRDGIKRPFIFSRWSGLGNQRYPIGFSGDALVTWKSLQFQPYFTATAANVGYGWWSHDIGGHMGGVEEPELYLRWLQYGVLSPIMRTHSTNSAYHERRPWAYDAEIERLATRALRLRHALIPYLYTAAWHNFREGILPIRPMYHLYPDEKDAYQCPDQYSFGSELIAAPFVTPCYEDTRMSRQLVWLPEGHWFDFFTGDYYQGGGWYAIYGDLERILTFAKAGGIVPLNAEPHQNGVNLPEYVTIKIFPGASNEFTLYEDDGETQAYLSGSYALTNMQSKWEPEKLTFRINPAQGMQSLLPPVRNYSLQFYAITPPAKVVGWLNGNEIKLDGCYDQQYYHLTINGIMLSPRDELVVEVLGQGNLCHEEPQIKASVLYLLKQFKLNTYIKQALTDQIDQLLVDPRVLLHYADRMTDNQLLALVETWMGLYPDKMPVNPPEAFQKIINAFFN